MNGPTFFSIAAILLIVFLMTAPKKRGQKKPLFGKVVDADDQEYTFYEF